LHNVDFFGDQAGLHPVHCGINAAALKFRARQRVSISSSRARIELIVKAAS